VNMGYYVTQDKRVMLRVVRHNERPQYVEAPFRPYFYVEEPKVTVVRYYASRVGIPITVHNTDLRTIDGTVVSKVETQLPKQVGLLRRVMPKGLALEADIPFDRRVRIDWTGGRLIRITLPTLTWRQQHVTLTVSRRVRLLVQVLFHRVYRKCTWVVSLTSLNGFQTWSQSTGLNS